MLRVELLDGLGKANVWLEDGYGRALGRIVHVTGVHTRAEAIAEARRRQPKELA